MWSRLVKLPFMLKSSSWSQSSVKQKIGWTFKLNEMSNHSNDALGICSIFNFNFNLETLLLPQSLSWLLPSSSYTWLCKYVLRPWWWWWRWRCGFQRHHVMITFVPSTPPEFPWKSNYGQHYQPLHHHRHRRLQLHC